MPEEDFKTLIDKIVEIIQQKGSATIEEVAQTLALEESRVEKLALLLEESGLIKIRYSFLFPNKTTLIAKDLKKSKEERSKNHRIQEILDKMDEDMLSSEKTFLICESPLLDKLKEAEDIINELDEKTKSASKDELTLIIGEAEHLEKITSTFNKEINQLDSRVKKFRDRIKKVKGKASSIGKKTIFQKILEFFAGFKKR